MLKKYERIWNTTKYLIELKNYNSNDSDENYMKINFNSDDDFPLEKILEK